MKSVELSADKKSRRFLELKMRDEGGHQHFLNPEVVPEDVQQAQALVDEIQKALASR